MKLLTPLAAALLLAAPAAASAASCAAMLEPTQAALDTYIEAVAAKGATADESTGALLDHDPSPAGLARSEAAIGDGTVPMRAQKALDEARAAQAAGEEAKCLAEVAKARSLIGLK
ncbi:hypothetical protein MWN33_02935 [Starkeya koreensis]|uniref:Uncharacterized protein n=1 Tax=Ancylobacter koreensis TaxID=266121 RepID=A0ABT0DI75_9HYPH|nr:hypothetical protein [Ancylobacter koreensis]MCK0206982.1 hypothetical protein [Ancylobacter koreensis]